MIRRFVWLLTSLALVGPVSCLDDGGPPDFTVDEDTCYPGDTLVCDECPGPERGLRMCDPDGRFGECTCPGCTSFPDCDECGDDCFESCMCQTARRSETACRETCGPLASDASTP